VIAIKRSSDKILLEPSERKFLMAKQQLQILPIPSEYVP
jgi:hypothetical protein